MLIKSLKCWTNRRAITVSMRPYNGYKVRIIFAEIHMGYSLMIKFTTKDRFEPVFFQSINRSRPVLNGPVVVAPYLGRSGCGCGCRLPLLGVKKPDWTGPSNTRDHSIVPLIIVLEIWQILVEEYSAQFMTYSMDQSAGYKAVFPPKLVEHKHVFSIRMNGQDMNSITSQLYILV